MQAEFYGAVAHDLRAPLSTITLALRNLESSEGKPEMHAKYLEIVNRRTGRMFALIDSLLDYFSLQSGKARLELTICDVNQVLEEICEDAAAEAHNRGQTIEVQPLPGDATAVVDKTKLARVLENLLTNAMKYSGSRTVIRIAARELEGGTLRFDVSDQGPGINAQEQPIIFDPFVRGRNGGEGTGRGLGLAICKSFVSAHGGEIWVESSPGQGSRFSFRIPRLSAHMPGHLLEGVPLHAD
jgi:signal transduction histidine kinase